MGVIKETGGGRKSLKLISITDNSGNIVELQPYHTYLVNGKDMENFKGLEQGVGTPLNRTVYFDKGYLGADQINTCC